MVEVVSDYKRKLASRYIPVTNDEVGTRLRKSEEYIYSIKEDGVFAALSFDGKKCALIFPNGKTITDLPLLDEAKNTLKEPVLLAGELICNTNKRSRSFEVMSALSESKEHDKLTFVAFDIIQDERPVFERRKAVSALIDEQPHLRAAVQNHTTTRKDISAAFDALRASSDIEGLVVTLKEGLTFKVKELHDLDVVVLGYSEGANKGVLRELLTGVLLEDNTYQVVAGVGTGFSDQERKDFVKELSKNVVSSDIIIPSSEKVAFHMVKPEKVISITCLDFIGYSSKGKIRKQKLNYKEGYTMIGNEVTCSLIAPVFKSKRKDKKVSVAETGMDQITHVFEIDKDTAYTAELQPSKMLKREVYVKETKGVRAVRKFMTWKTNKEASQVYPAYVFMYSDFSPTRKAPLATEIKISSSEDEILSIYEAEKTDNVKKGWEAV